MFMKLRSVFPEIWSKLWKKCPLSHYWIYGSRCRWLPKFNISSSMSD